MEASNIRLHKGVEMTEYQIIEYTQYFELEKRINALAEKRWDLVNITSMACGHNKHYTAALKRMVNTP